MNKHIPFVLQPHILPLNWEVTKVWALNSRVHQAWLSHFEYLLELPIWSSRPNAGMLFDITPMKLIKQPESCPYQMNRVRQANIKYPIDFLNYEGKLWILDGVHRLANMKLKGFETIFIRIHPETVIPLIKR